MLAAFRPAWVETTKGAASFARDFEFHSQDLSYLRCWPTNAPEVYCGVCVDMLKS